MKKRICVYSDVHGNIEALNMLMNTDDYKNSDFHIFLGDAVSMCPYPKECVEKIFNSNDVWLMGNHDYYMAFGLPIDEYPYFKDEKKAHLNYMKNKVDNHLRKRMKLLPKDYQFVIEGKTFYFIHYIWESEKLIADELKENTEENLKTLFKGINADYIIFGHEHKPFIVEGKKTTYLCVGSLGVKYPGNYVVLEIDGQNVNIIRKNIYFDVEKLKETMIKLDYPRAKNYTIWFEN